MCIRDSSCTIGSTSSSLGKGMCKACKLSQIASHISLTILPTVTSEILNEYPSVLNEEPVAKYLQQELTNTMVKEREMKKINEQKEKI